MDPLGCELDITLIPEKIYYWNLIKSVIFHTEVKETYIPTYIDPTVFNNKNTIDNTRYKTRDIYKNLQIFTHDNWDRFGNLFLEQLTVL